MYTPKILYSSEEYTFLEFNLLVPGAAESLHWARAVWQERSDIEALDQDHFVLIVRTDEAERGYY